MRAAAHWLFALHLAACGGGGGEGDTSGCSGNCGITTPVSLTVADVEQVVRQAVHEAQARSAPATIAVIDRVGNVLAVFTMTGAAPTFTITSGRGVSGGLENVSILPPQFPAIAKAITAAYFSSEGQAFTSRTAGQVVQENFNPGEINSPGGPLFGVQFSNLTCSDVNQLSPSVTAGPKASPLGFAADPGGLPLYKGGSVVGAIGVMSDGIYGVDLDIFDVEQNSDELIAVAGARGFDAPTNRRADRITAERGLRYTDSESLASNPASAPAFAALPGVLVDVPGFFSPAAVRAGTAYGTPASGYRPATDPAFAGLNAFVLDDGTGTQRFPPVAGTDGLLTQAEVTTLLAEGIRVANRTRSQIRQPLGSAAQVTVAVVDTNGAIVGLLRTPDALVDSTDVTPLKARTALLFSHPNTAADLAAAPPANYLSPPAQSPISTYVSNIQALIPGALSNGIAYSSRAVGNLARPFLPDGINGTGPGPLAKPFASWSVFSTGLSLDLVHDRLVANLLSPPGPAPGAPPVPGAGNCTTLARARTGILLFPGGFPIFRGGTLVGAIAASGDGSDQSDLIAFLGLANAGKVLGTGIAHAPAAQRTDTISVPGGRLRYVGCPFAPLLDTTASNVCDGI